MKLRLIMDSGKEYVVDQDIELLTDSFLTEDGALINRLVHLSNVAINPSHISSIEYLDDLHDLDDELLPEAQEMVNRYGG